MKKNLITLALIALVAGVCLSAKATPQKKERAEDRQEIAMSKCSRTKKNSDDESCRSSSPSWKIRNGYQENQAYKPKSGEFASQRKSAAQKVMEGY